MSWAERSAGNLAGITKFLLAHMFGRIDSIGAAACDCGAACWPVGKDSGWQGPLTGANGDDTDLLNDDS
jgi:hypothetical protein